MNAYEVGYKNCEYEVECKLYDNLEEATRAFKYLEEKVKQYAAEGIYTYIHKYDVKNVFSESDYDIDTLCGN